MWNSLRTFVRRITSLRLYLKDPDQSKLKKILIIFGIIYLLSPLDLVPEPVFGLGLIDDAVLWVSILSYLAKELDSYQDTGEMSREAKRRYHGTAVYETEAEVVEDVQSEGEEKT